MGSQSDWATMRRAGETLDQLAVGFDAQIISAHRTPDRLVAFAKGARKAGFKLIIAGAGGAAHLPGMTAAFTPLPVFGVPVASKALSGQDSLLSIVQMPAGVPVGTLAIGEAGAVNAALLAAAVLALSDSALADRLDAWRAAHTQSVADRPSDASACRAAMILAPGATIGILGAGQLGRMLAMAAARLGLRSHVFAPEAEAPAFDVASARTIGAYEDETALAAFAEAVDVVTYEFENVPTACVDFLSALRPVRPGVRALSLTQDRWVEKSFLSDLGLRTAPFMAVEDAGALVRAVAALGRPSILKTRRFGYDGKGQALIREGSNLSALYRGLGGAPTILEGFVAFEREVSVVAARGLEGAFAAFDLCENEHERHILARTRVPAAIAPATAAAAVAIAAQILEALDYVGVLAVEMFVTREADGSKALSSTNWRRASIIPAIGPSTARKPRNSSSMCARSPAGRLAPRPGGDGSRCIISLAKKRRNGGKFWPSPTFACISTARWRSARAAKWVT